MTTHGEKRKSKAYNHVNGYTDEDSDSPCMLLCIPRADVKVLTGKEIEFALKNGTDDDETSSSIYYSVDESDHDEKLQKSKSNLKSPEKTKEKNLSPINENCKVSPLKLKRKMEYAVDKVHLSSSKNSNKVVSPIIIKRKTEIEILTPSKHHNCNKNEEIVTPKRTPMAQVNGNSLEKLTPRRSARKQVFVVKEETPSRNLPKRKSKVLASRNLLDSSFDDFDIGSAIKGCGRNLRVKNTHSRLNSLLNSSSESEEDYSAKKKNINIKLNDDKNTSIKKSNDINSEKGSSKVNKTPKKVCESDCSDYLEGIAPLELPKIDKMDVKTPKSTKKSKNASKCKKESSESFDNGVLPLDTPTKKTPRKKEEDNKDSKSIMKDSDDDIPEKEKTPMSIRKSRRRLKSENEDEGVVPLDALDVKTPKSRNNKKTTKKCLNSDSEDEKDHKSTPKSSKKSVQKKDTLDFSDDEDEPVKCTKTPSTKRKLMKKDDSESDEDVPSTPRTRRRTNINYCETSPKLTPLKTPARMSLRRKVLEANTPKMTPDTKLEKLKTPKTTPKNSARKKLNLTPTTPHSLKKVGHGFLTPVITEREKNIETPKNDLDYARSQLQVATLPSSLPCREKEYKNIESFLVRKLEDMTGGCMYISGVPGTGKTATVHTVVKHLQQSAQDDEIPVFDFVEINGLRLTEPKQAYVRIWQMLTKTKLSSEEALKNLEGKYNGKNKRSTILLVDELDYLCNKRQDVIYNILDWTTKRNSKLIVLTIANTMDLPERTLKGKVSSRMGLTRLVFHPYTYQQLQEIVMNRLNGCESFQADAVQLVSRKVAAVSGDARRALDICRRSTELLKSKEDIVTVEHIQKALTQIFAGVRVQAIKNCSTIGKLILKSLKDEVIRTGVEETTVGLMLPQLIAVCAMDSCPVPTVGEILTVCSILSDSGLIIAEKGRGDLNRKLSLNVSPDDIHYAISCS